MSPIKPRITIPRCKASQDQVLEQAAEILSRRHYGKTAFTNADDSMRLLQCKLGHQDREIFSAMFLDSQHRLIEYRELFMGTINSAAVYPREIVKAALEVNAAALIVAHNHPSGVAEPSQADIQMTERIKKAMQLIDVTLLDHIVIGEDCVSLAQRGLV